MRAFAPPDAPASDGRERSFVQHRLAGIPRPRGRRTIGARLAARQGHRFCSTAPISASIGTEAPSRRGGGRRNPSCKAKISNPTDRC